MADVKNDGAGRKSSAPPAERVADCQTTQRERDTYSSVNPTLGTDGKVPPPLQRKAATCDREGLTADHFAEQALKAGEGLRANCERLNADVDAFTGHGLTISPHEQHKLDVCAKKGFGRE